jgi:hypothetical protein
MAAAMRKAGDDVRFLRLEGGGHALSDGTGLGQEEYELAIDTPEAWMAIMDFLARTVGTP